MWLITTFQKFVNAVKNVLMEHVQGQQDKQLHIIKLFLWEQVTISDLVLTIATTNGIVLRRHDDWCGGCIH